MKYFILLLSIIAIALIAFNCTKLDFNNLLKGESFTAVLTITTSLCALILLQILRLSKKIEILQKNKK